MRLAGEYGIGLDLVLYFSLFPDTDDTTLQKLYWQYTLTRLAKYANIFTWEIANEYIRNEEFQDAAGSFFKSNDPHHRPVCTSDGTTDDAVWPEKSWMDLAINHSCTSSGGEYPLDNWYLAAARNTRSHGKPAFCNESGREKRHKNDDGIHRRKQGWLWCSAGCYWTWHSWDGCEGIDDNNYRAPGQEFLKPMADFFRAIPFYKLSPNFTVITISYPQLVSAVLADPERTLITAYMCTYKTGTVVRNAAAQVRLPNGQYRVNFIMPWNLEIYSTEGLRSSGLKDILVIQLPSFKDDLVIKIERILSKDKTIIPGTE